MAYLRLDDVNHNMARTFEAGAEILGNGSFVKVGNLKNSNDGRDIYAVAELSDVAGASYAFIAHDGHRYQAVEDEADIEVKPGELTRGYLLSRGDVITIEKAMVTGNVVVGDLLAPGASGYKLKKAEGASVNKIAVVELVEKFNGRDCYVIRFL